MGAQYVYDDLVYMEVKSLKLGGNDFYNNVDMS